MSSINLGSAQDLYFNIINGTDSGYEKIHKFGRNSAVGTSMVPVCVGGVYQTPTTPTTLEAISASANDTSAGTGARVITVVGLNSSGEQVEEDITLSGLTATSATSNSFIRVYKVFVKTSGTYATATAASHSGDITIRASGGGVIYATIDSTGFPRASSQIACYTVPSGKTAFVKNITITTSAPTNIMIFKRSAIGTIVAPFEPMRLLQEYDNVDGIEYLFTTSPLGTFEEKTDFGFMAYTDSGTSKVSVDFDIIQSI